MAKLAGVLYICSLLHLISAITDVSSNFLFQRSVGSNRSTRVSLVENLGIEPEAIWDCLCKGTQLEFYTRRGIYEANDPNAPVQPPGAGNPNTPSSFQDSAASLAFYQMSLSLVGSDQNLLDELDEVSTALSALGVRNDKPYYSWNAWVHRLFRSRGQFTITDNLICDIVHLQ